jgi:hypothetical protein
LGRLSTARERRRVRVDSNPRLKFPPLSFILPLRKGNNKLDAFAKGRGDKGTLAGEILLPDNVWCLLSIRVFN